MTELEIYSEMANIVLNLLQVKRIASPINQNYGYNHIIDHLYETIDIGINKLPIDVMTLNQFVKLVMDTRRFKPMQNNKIHIFKQFKDCTVIFHNPLDLNDFICIFDSNEIKTISDGYKTITYTENYNSMIRDGICAYFKECVDIIFHNQKKGK